MVYKIIEDILKKKVPFRITDGDTSYRKLNHILMTNAPHPYRDQVLFDYENDEIFDEYSIVHFYNKKYDICIDLKVRYVMYMGDPSKSHFKATGYKLYRGEK